MATKFYVRALRRVFTEEEFRGLGDVVAAATKAVGIKPCGGCAKRREALNHMVPFVDTPPKEDGRRLPLHPPQP